MLTAGRSWSSITAAGISAATAASATRAPPATTTVPGALTFAVGGGLDLENTNRLFPRWYVGKLGGNSTQRSALFARYSSRIALFISPTAWRAGFRTRPVGSAP